MIDKLQFTFHQWENIPANGEDHVHLTKELLGSCDSIEWQVDELEKTISVAARDPAWFGINEVELGKRRRWTSIARTQVGNVKKAVGGKDLNGKSISNKIGERRELMRVPHSKQQDRTPQYIAGENDDFISSESDRQMLLIKQQDEELDEMSEGIQRIGNVGLTIHEELLAQDQIIDELGTEMESTSNRLDFVQKKVGMVMKKAGMKEPARNNCTWDMVKCRFFYEFDFIFLFCFVLWGFSQRDAYNRFELLRAYWYFQSG
ncbi:syntaxin-61-like isoform X2 [Cynara cardunculus var. scolymus]|uniref:syntaxin-61-like isoform X2 n=1 Tax=Cynara cardunculus var. scolymus TaxID=59895 RepID=UPI000D62A0DB|nr:syntaxin-61-like isoform X2 [Cynara cardunculus var. scolymus]